VGYVPGPDTVTKGVALAPAGNRSWSFGLKLNHCRLQTEQLIALDCVVCQHHTSERIFLDASRVFKAHLSSNDTFMMMAVFWVIAPCSLVEVSHTRRHGTTAQKHTHCRENLKPHLTFKIQRALTF
jgi:hypothetical protein